MDKKTKKEIGIKDVANIICELKKKDKEKIVLQQIIIIKSPVNINIYIVSIFIINIILSLSLILTSAFPIIFLLKNAFAFFEYIKNVDSNYTTKTTK